MSHISDFLKQSQNRVNDALEQLLSTQQSAYTDHNDALLKTLISATQYSIHNGGKRLRPALLYATVEALAPATDTKDIDLVASALECIHSYSLVHDDLPAMDDDALRRGKPTCHIQYTEATAILVGDGLQSLAFELLTHTQTINPDIQIALVQQLAQAAGNCGMVGGQMIDLQSVDQQISLAHLQHMHSLKTGALIRASVAMGAIAAQADKQTRSHLDDYANAIGLAFQVQDDILDIESATEVLGKTQGADKELNKPTYPALLGLEEAKEKAEKLVQQAHTALSHINVDSTRLQQIADFIITRNH